MNALKKAYDKWQCIEKNDNDIGMLMFSRGDLLSFAEYYHQSQVNNVVLDAVIKCNHNWNYHLLGFERICTICKEVDMIDNVL
mgnify:CR=1 FL=1|tara:strand:+ start:367 stop:615 length:249 start_codon:yes stop_codon:yes gene_type:complete